MAYAVLMMDKILNENQHGGLRLILSLRAWEMDMPHVSTLNNDMQVAAIPSNWTYCLL